MISERLHSLHNRVLSSGHVLQVSEYTEGGRVSIQAFTKDGEPECSITVNLPGHLLLDDEFFVRSQTQTWSPDVCGALIRDGIARPTGVYVSAGFVEGYAEIWALL